MPATGPVVVDMGPDTTTHESLRHPPGPAIEPSVFRQAIHHLPVTVTGQGLFDVTAAVVAWVRRQGIGTGLLTVWCPHTSVSLIVQANADPEVRADLEAFFVRLAPESPGLYRHEPQEPDNMPAHIRAALTQSQVVVPVEHGEPCFGEFQALYLFEHRHVPGDRRLVLSLLGA